MTDKPSISGSDTGSRGTKIAVVVHVYDRDLWAELGVYLRNIPSDFALFVSMPKGTDASFVLHDFPAAHTLHVRNVGRDVAPFLQLLPQLQTFDVVCKVHSKSDDEWRAEALRALLGHPDLVAAVIRAFATDPQLLMAGPSAFWADGPTHVHENGPRLDQLASRLNVFGPSHGLPESYCFFAGTMFWMRPAAFADLATLADLKFVKHRDRDGHPEHAIERLFGCIASARNGRVALIDMTNSRNPHLTLVPAASRTGRDIVKSLAELSQRYASPIAR